MYCSATDCLTQRSNLKNGTYLWQHFSILRGWRSILLHLLHLLLLLLLLHLHHHLRTHARPHPGTVDGAAHHAPGSHLSHLVWSHHSAHVCHLHPLLHHHLLLLMLVHGCRRILWNLQKNKTQFKEFDALIPPFN